MQSAIGARCDRFGNVTTTGDCAYDLLFPGQPWQPPGKDPAQAIFVLSESLYESGKSTPGKIIPEATIPAAYAFFGQFITHDLTYALGPINQRTPRFDLDCLYGRGPLIDAHLYQLRDPRLFAIGQNEFGELDLPRNSDSSLDMGTTTTFNRRRSALIGDPRNDENVIVSQLHLAFLLFHNALVEGGSTFEEARRKTRWAYQQAMIEFLERVCEPAIVAASLGKGGVPNLKFVKVGGARMVLPFEFSLAAFRFGHSMIGESYHLNDQLESERGKYPEFRMFAFGPNDWKLRNRQAENTLEGQRELPRKWTIQWDRFIGDSVRTQRSRKIDPKLSDPLRSLPLEISTDASDERERSLAYVTLLRGWLHKLRSGQDIAREMNEAPLPRIADGDDPLWLYVLREAKEIHDGERLGPVGSRIVAEVCVGLLASDPESFYSTHASSSATASADTSGFTLERVLRDAGVPITSDDWNRKVPNRAKVS